MNRDALNALPVLVLTSPFDWPLMLAERFIPFRPDLSKGRRGSWAHAGKNWWTESFRADAQWWSKLARFLVWWLCVLWIVT